MFKATAARVLDASLRLERLGDLRLAAAARHVSRDLEEHLSRDPQAFPWSLTLDAGMSRSTSGLPIIDAPPAVALWDGLANEIVLPMLLAPNGEYLRAEYPSYTEPSPVYEWEPERVDLRVGLASLSTYARVTLLLGDLLAYLTDGPVGQRSKDGRLAAGDRVREVHAAYVEQADAYADFALGPLEERLERLEGTTPASAALASVTPLRLL